MPYRMDPSFSKRITDAVSKVAEEVFPKGAITGHSMGFVIQDVYRRLTGACEGYLLCQIEEGAVPFDVAFSDECIRVEIEEIRHLLSLDGKFSHFWAAQFIWASMDGEKFGLSE